MRYAYLSWADWDNDGDLDLVITGMERNGTSLTRLYRNTDGILLLDEGNSEALINAHNGDLAWGDVDNDGDLDLALSGENIIPEGGLYNVTEFYLNDPPGTLSLAANLVLIDNDSGDPLQIRRDLLPGPTTTRTATWTWPCPVAISGSTRC